MGACSFTMLLCRGSSKSLQEFRRNIPSLVSPLRFSLLVNNLRTSFSHSTGHETISIGQKWLFCSSDTRSQTPRVTIRSEQERGNPAGETPATTWFVLPGAPWP